MSLSPITRMEHTGEHIMSFRDEEDCFTFTTQLLNVFPSPFSKYSSRPLRRASSCCSERENGHFPGSLGNVKLTNSRLRFWCRMTNSRKRLEHSCLPAMYTLYTWNERMGQLGRDRHSYLSHTITAITPRCSDAALSTDLNFHLIRLWSQLHTLPLPSQLTIYSKVHPPQTFPGWAQCACSWAQIWGQPVCQSSRSRTERSRHPRDPNSRPPAVGQAAQPAPALSLRPGSGQPPAYGSLPLHSLRFYQMEKKMSIITYILTYLFLYFNGTINSQWRCYLHCLYLWNIWGCSWYYTDLNCAGSKRKTFSCNVQYLCRATVFKLLQSVTIFTAC